MTDKRKDYTYCTVHGGGREPAEWRIFKRRKNGLFPDIFSGKPVWTFPFQASHFDHCEPPPEVRAKYEELIEYDPNDDPGSQLNVVEICAMGDDESANLCEPCVFGHRVENHAVYCHNSKWLYSPRKCSRRADDPKYRHEDCPGFVANHRLASGMPLSENNADCSRPKAGSPTGKAGDAQGPSQ